MELVQVMPDANYSDKPSEGFSKEFLELVKVVPGMTLVDRKRKQ